MNVKKIYNINDTVWIYGIERSNKPVEGKIVKSFDIPGYVGTHYVVAIPTHIEDLLEIRTWETISQDGNGPIGMFRSIAKELEPTHKFMRKAGYTLADQEDDEPSQEQILAAIEKSAKVAEHDPLVLKENRPRRRRFTKKKKQ